MVLPVDSSSFASLSSASFCDAAAACRSLALADSPAFRRNSALLAAYSGPSSWAVSRLNSSFLTHSFQEPAAQMLFVAAVAFAPRQLAPQLKPAQRPAAVLLEATAESTAVPAAAEESSPAPTAADPAVATLDLLEWPRLSAHVAQHASTASLSARSTSVAWRA